MKAEIIFMPQSHKNYKRMCGFWDLYVDKQVYSSFYALKDILSFDRTESFATHFRTIKFLENNLLEFVRILFNEKNEINKLELLKLEEEILKKDISQNEILVYRVSLNY